MQRCALFLLSALVTSAASAQDPTTAPAAASDDAAQVPAASAAAADDATAADAAAKASAIEADVDADDTAAAASDPAASAEPAAEAPPPPPPAPSSPAPATSSPSPATDPANVGVADEVGPRFGDPTPLSRREPTLKAGTLMAGIRYGLVGNGPTRFVDDVRYAITDHLEIRTALLPWPTSLMARYRLGSVNDDLGAFVVDGGLSYFDAGIRLVEDTGEPAVGVRLHFEGVLLWQKALFDSSQLWASAHYRNRTSFLPDDGQNAVAVAAGYTQDILPNINLGAGLGFASTIGGPVREVVVNFTETDRAGITHLLARDDGGEQSLTIPLTLTYGRVDSFDVDLFCTPRVYPTFGILFGAGVRLRIEDVFGG